ncbi:MAG TPA: FkbM family methyltransferase, partial [Bacteroidia bacterium]|nr:FkbM family methyltransferase [Bacteroidia bacterium]
LLMEKLNSKQDLLSDLAPVQKKEWQERIEDVKSCPDNLNIPRVPDAGQLIDGNLIMHNGIKIDPLSYYGFPILKMLLENKGVHEPQEEKVFQEVLASLQPGKKTILELGAYWSFYSMWFLKTFPGSDAYMIEPDIRNLYSGKKNFELNNLHGTFLQSFVGETKKTKEKIISPDAFCKKNNISFVDILHSDIQGFELEMLKGSRNLLTENKIGYCFISTHSNELHEQCISFLKNFGFVVVANANLDESFSFDGIIVMKAPGYPGISSVEISKKGK